MTRIGKRVLVLLVSGVLALGALNAFGVAYADWVKTGSGHQKFGDGQDYYWEEWTDPETGDSQLWYAVDGGWEVLGNPGPDDDTSGTDPMGVQEAIDHAKNGAGGDLFAGLSLETSPVGEVLESHGDGPSTVWNPGDNADGTGQGNPMAGIDEKEPIEFSFESPSGDGIQEDAGSPEDQVNSKKTPQGGSGGPVVTSGGDDGAVVDSGPGKDDDEPWTYQDFAPKVNPNPEDSDAAREEPASGHGVQTEEEEIN